MPKWNDTRVIDLHRVRTTQALPSQPPEAAIAGKRPAPNARINFFPMAPLRTQTRRVKQAFTRPNASIPYESCSATDALGRASTCKLLADLFHFDVPWNPSRWSSDGRIDRQFCKPRTKSFCHYFVFIPSVPKIESLQCFGRKTETIKKELGSLSQVIRRPSSASRLSAGFSRRDRRSGSPEIDANRHGREPPCRHRGRLEAVSGTSNRTSRANLNRLRHCSKIRKSSG